MNNIVDSCFSLNWKLRKLFSTNVNFFLLYVTKISDTTISKINLLLNYLLCTVTSVCGIWGKSKFISWYQKYRVTTKLSDKSCKNLLQTSFWRKREEEDVKKASKYYQLLYNVYNGINISFSTYIIPNIPIKGKSLVFYPHLVYL